MLYPNFDQDLNLMFLSGKGDGIVRTLEFSAGNLYHSGNDGYKSNVPGKAYAFLPKYCVNTS